MTPEAKVKKKVVTHLKTLGAYYFYPVTGGYGKSGVPDIIGCYKGLFFGIECKAGKNKPTPLQEKNLNDIKLNQGIALVINETNIDDVLSVLEERTNAMTPEAKVKKKVVTHLKTLGAYYFYPVTGGYGKSGVPDIIGCYKGLFFGIECKAGKNKPTPLQEKNLNDIKLNQGIALVINETNIDDVLSVLEERTNAI